MSYTFRHTESIGQPIFHLFADEPILSLLSWGKSKASIHKLIDVCLEIQALEVSKLLGVNVAF